jgi:hypothetical protein
METSLTYLAEGLAIDRAIDEPQRLYPIMRWMRSAHFFIWSAPSQIG